MESADFICSLYQHFLFGLTKKSLNAFYYVCSYVRADYPRFMNVTASRVLRLVSDLLGLQPIFLCIDDTMAPKFGKRFESACKLFDHAAHNGSNYLNGHCFVSVVLCIPVWNKGRIHYLSGSLGYCMWQRKESKLELAASMVRQVMPEFGKKKNVIFICDRWYMKQGLVCVVDKYENLDTVGNVRSDSVLYGLAPQPTGRRGRPVTHGGRISI